MADPPKKKKNFFQKVAKVFQDFAEWIEETFSDPEMCAAIKDDLGLDASNPATPPATDPERKKRIDEFAKKQDIDEAALAEIIGDITALADTILAFVDAIKADAVDPWTLFWMLFKVFSLETLRVRNPSAYALVRLGGMATQDEETVPQLDAAALAALVRPEPEPQPTPTEAEEEEQPAVGGEALVQRLSMLIGLAIVMTANFWDALDGEIDALYGWDPDPEDVGESAVVASRALTLILSNEALGGIRPALTSIVVPRGHGGPGIFLSASAGFEIPMDAGNTTYTMEVTGAGRFGAFIPLKSDAGSDLRFFGGFAPAIRVSAEPRVGEDRPPDAPAFVIGTSDATRIEVGAFAFGIEIADDKAAFRAALRKGKIVIALGKGDAFLRQLPGGNVEAPFEVGMIADTKDGVRLEGGTSAKVNLPVSGSLFGVFTVQFLELTLGFQPAFTGELRAGFSVKLGPFAASVDRAGLVMDTGKVSEGMDKLDEMVSFAPPKGIGLTINSGPLKGGGYLFVDAQRGEYAGALELKFKNFSIKAIGVVATKRPDGSEGWSLLLFVFGQFNWHIGFNIFWTGLGGMIGLHHRSDMPALIAGMKTGALDDVLFPVDPIADAPRIINRYRTLFPPETNSLVVGPMLELSFSKPPIVYARIGLLFDVRNAMGGEAKMSLARVILLGQVLVQLPPKETKAPAILKLLIDVVGYYDTATDYLQIRARLRDSFVGVEKVGKLNLSGELLVSVQFGGDSNLVLSAGGFHPKYTGLPAGVPGDLERLKAGVKIKKINLAIEMYFAVTPNSVQGGWKATLKADFSVAGIEASLGFDAIFYLSPRFHFVVDIEFKAKVKAFGRTLAAVGVRATVEGPDRWRLDGEFSFSILWWDKTVSFDEIWGVISAATTAAVSLAEVLIEELAKPENLAVEAPATSASLVTLAGGPSTATLAHPLGRLAIRQGAVPLGVKIDRIGTQPLTGGPATAAVESVHLNDDPLPEFESATEQFARGQYMELNEDERLTGKVFEPFPSGVVVGKSEHVTPTAALARDVKTSFETVRLDPQPKSPITKWSGTRIGKFTPGYSVMANATKLGAAARSDRARDQQRAASPLSVSAVSIGEPPMALVGARNLIETADLVGAAATSPTIAGQEAAAGGHRVVELFEVVA